MNDAVKQHKRAWEYDAYPPGWRGSLLLLPTHDKPSLIHYGEYDILHFGSSSKRRATSERKKYD